MVRRKSSTPKSRGKALKFATSTPKPGIPLQEENDESSNLSSLNASQSQISKRASTSRKTASKSPSASRSRVVKRYRPGALALKQIRMYQRSTKLLIPKRPFSRLVREVVENLARSTGNRQIMFLRIQQVAMEALQEAAEHYLVHLLEDAYLCSMHARRITLQAKDLQLVRRIRGLRDLN